MADETFRWRRVDLTDGGHSFLDPDDCVLYYMDRVHGGFDKSAANQKIVNIKMGVNQSSSRLYFRNKAINEYARNMVDLICGFPEFQEAALVPIPPSEARDDPEYDDKMERVCSAAAQLARKRGLGLSVSNLLSQIESHEPFHENDKMRNPDTIYRNLVLDKTLIPSGICTFILVDDVFTSGSHFVACKRKILNAIPDASIAGIMWAKQLSYDEEFKMRLGEFG